MEQLIWPEIPAEELIPRETSLPAKKQTKSLPFLLLGGLYAAGILWGKSIAPNLPKKLADMADVLLSDFFASIGTGSTLSLAVSLLLPAMLWMLLTFLGGFSAIGFLFDLPILFCKGALYGIMTAGLAGQEHFGTLAALLAPFEALGSFCLIVLVKGSVGLSLQLLKTLGEGELSEEFPLLKNFLTLLFLLLLLSLFALLSAATAELFAAKLPLLQS